MTPRDHLLTILDEEYADSNVHALFPAPASQFEAVWKLWPNKAKKPLAKARYDALLRGPLRTRTLDKDSGQYVEIEITATEAQIVAGVRAYLDSQVDRTTFKMKDDGRFIPHLATFLNQGRFLDLIEAS